MSFYNPMIPKCNLHTHTRFCDGKDSPEEVVLAAIAAGMETLGFSGHSGLPFSTTWTMNRERIKEYQKEILRLKEVYQDRLHILLGIEQDLLTGIPDYPYDYVIGSVHCLQADGEYFMVDESAEVLKNAAQKHFGGDFYKLCKAYYEMVAQVVDKTRCDIVGHFDLVTKFNEGGVHFDENNERYVAAAERAIKKLCAQGMIFEINTGAISRGHRTVPYPSKRFLEAIRREGGRITYSSDCHDGNYIACAFEESVALAKECGFEGFMKLTDNGFVFEKFDDEE